MDKKVTYQPPRISHLGSLAGRTGFFGPAQVSDVAFGADGETPVDEGTGSRDGIIVPVPD